MEEGRLQLLVALRSFTGGFILLFNETELIEEMYFHPDNQQTVFCRPSQHTGIPEVTYPHIRYISSRMTGFGRTYEVSEGPLLLVYRN